MYDLTSQALFFKKYFLTYYVRKEGYCSFNTLPPSDAFWKQKKIF